MAAVVLPRGITISDRLSQLELEEVGDSTETAWGIPLYSELDDTCVVELTRGDDLEVCESASSSDEKCSTDLPVVRHACHYDQPDSADKKTDNPNLAEVRNQHEETDNADLAKVENQQEIKPSVFYKSMYANGGGPLKKPRKVTINLNDASTPWREAIKFGIKQIEMAAPGLHFIYYNQVDRKLDIFVTMINGRSETSGTLRFPIEDEIYKVKMCLTESLNGPRKKAIATHELLHALGFEHEHQRSDRGHYVEIHESSRNSPSMKRNKFFKPLTPFDEYSIMLYEIGDLLSLKRDKNKKIYRENREMSQMDKIALNMVHPPSERENYQPIKSVHGMYYCGRENVMMTHNQPYSPLVNQCGPEWGPNCAACRVLSKPTDIGDRWQGQSNYVYCGKVDCGPDVHEACEACRKIVGELCEQ